MDYAVSHTTKFDYEFPVRFARCNLRLHPIDWDGQAVESYALTIDPPATVLPGRDNGYCVLAERFVLDKPASELVIASRSRIRVERAVPEPAPGDMTVAAAATAAREARALDKVAPANFLYPSPLIAAFPEIADWCAEELRP